MLNNAQNRKCSDIYLPHGSAASTILLYVLQFPTKI